MAPPLLFEGGRSLLWLLGEPVNGVLFMAAEETLEIPEHSINHGYLLGGCEPPYPLTASFTMFSSHYYFCEEERLRHPGLGSLCTRGWLTKASLGIATHHKQGDIVPPSIPHQIRMAGEAL